MCVDAFIRECERRLQDTVRGKYALFYRQRNGETERVSMEAVIEYLMEMKRGALQRRDRIGDWMADEISLSDLEPASDL